MISSVSNSSVNLAVLGASTNVSSNDSNNAMKDYYCNQLMTSFNTLNSTVEQKQQYAECVDHLYPKIDGASLIVLKVIILVSIISFFVGTFIARKEGDNIIMSAIFGMVCCVGIGMLCFLLFIGLTFVFLG